MMKMLVVDDDPAWRALYRMAFDGHFEIYEASDGQQGLEALAAVDPDVIESSNAQDGRIGLHSTTRQPGRSRIDRRVLGGPRRGRAARACGDPARVEEP